MEKKTCDTCGYCGEERVGDHVVMVAIGKGRYVPLEHYCSPSCYQNRKKVEKAREPESPSSGG